MTSSRVTRPRAPEPSTCSRLTPCSRASLRTTGDVRPARRAPLSAPGDVAAASAVGAAGDVGTVDGRRLELEGSGDSGPDVIPSGGGAGTVAPAFVAEGGAAAA